MSNISSSDNRTPELEGKIKTIIDASVSDPIQRKAIKDLISEAIWSWYNRYSPTFIHVSYGEDIYKVDSQTGKSEKVN